MIQHFNEGLSRLDVDSRIDALRFQFSFPGADLEAFEQGLRRRAEARRRTLVLTGSLILLATLVLRYGSLAEMDAILYGFLALMLATGFDRCKKELQAADELEWLRHRLHELAPRGAP